MLRQQMRSCDRKIETVVVQSTIGPLRKECTSSTDASSIALTNNNIDSTSGFSTPSIDESTLRLHGCLTFDSLSVPLRYSSPTDDSTLRLHGCSTIDSSFRFPFQRSSVETVSSYEYYSHALACIATSSRECGLFTTSLDTLWYVYSYIYSQLSSNATTIMFLLFFVAVILMPTTDTPPTSTTVPNIRYEFESLHASPFWLLALLKPTTPFISIPLCTTSSTLHLLAFLASTVPSLPPPSWTLFVIFFLSPIGTVTLLRLELSFGTNILRSHLFLSPVVDGDTFGRTGTTTHIIQSRRTTDTDILRSQRLKFFAGNDAPVTVTMTTQVYSSSSSSPSKLSNNYMTFSAVNGAVTRTTTSYMSFSSLNLVPIIDQGSDQYSLYLASHVSPSYDIDSSPHTISSSTVQAFVATIFIGRTATGTAYTVHSRIIKDTDSSSHQNDNNYGSFGRVTTTTPSHIIDQGSVSYLALLQILLYDQQIIV